MVNQLIHETSPYLLEHADNPVNWYPWGQFALEKAQQENKPILLSIGYSACHWCHVMAEESFSDQLTSKLLNQFFISIKVDREERPDLDKIYQAAHFILTQRSGGWPLNVFLDPRDQTPFFAGTYFPLETKANMPSFQQILRFVQDIYINHQSQLNQQNEQIHTILTTLNIKTKSQALLTHAPLANAVKALSQEYDQQYGGFGQAPKFPNTAHLEYLLYSIERNHDENCQKMLTHTLNILSQSGLYDHLHGGFYRYSVDRQWRIPHFEKMLYDNAQLLTIYALAFAKTKQQRYKEIGCSIADWMIREMRDPNGGFYSTISADSEHEEGKYYTWHTDEIKRILTEKEYEIFSEYYGLVHPPNFEGKWHLYIDKDLPLILAQMELSPDQALQLLESAKEKLRVQSQRRVQPAIDKKIICSWNGLVIRALSLAGIHFQSNQYIDHAIQTTDFIQSHLWENKRLKASYKDKKALFNAYLDDYVFLMDGLTHLLQAHWRNQDFQFLLELIKRLFEQFIDESQGGFYFTANDHEQLILRPKSLEDEATPSGNGIAALTLLRLGYLLGHKNYIQAAEDILYIALESIKQHPGYFNTLLIALDNFLSPPQVIILRGNQQDIKKWQQALYDHPNIKRLCLNIPSTEKNLLPPLDQYKPLATVTAYICEGYHCRASITKLSEFIHFLGKGSQNY